MDLSTINFGQFADSIVNLIVALGALFAGVYGCSKKFRVWINTRLKDTDSIKDLDSKHKKLNERANSFEQHCNRRSNELTSVCNNIEDMLTKLDGRIDKLDTKIDQLDTRINNFDDRIDKLDKKIASLDNTTEKLDKKVEKDKESTILTLKYEILDICRRAKKYGCIVTSDKLLLCELYHEYVEVWHQNHYVKSEAEKVINTFDVIDEYNE